MIGIDAGTLTPAGPAAPESLVDAIDLIRALSRPRRTLVRYGYRGVTLAVRWQSNERDPGYPETEVRIVDHPYDRPLLEVPFLAMEDDLIDTVQLVQALDYVLDVAERSAETGLRT